MRVGLLIYGNINTISGGYLYDRKLVEFLRKNGDEVTIISLKKTSYFKALISNSIPVELKKIQLDILIQDELVHPSFWCINFKLKKILKCPIISLVHLFSSAMPGAPHKKLLYLFFEKRYLKSVDGLILNSEATLDQAGKILQKKIPSNLIAVPCGNNFSEIKEMKKNYSSKEFRILFVGNITQQKGLHVLIKSMYILDNKNISLSVIGYEDIEPRYLESIKKYIKINGLESRIKFFGPLERGALKDKYLEHDIFVLPSVNEAYGIVFLEAMQFYLPIIGCNLGGAKEIIEENVNGYLIDPDDSIRLAELIDSINTNRQLLEQLSKSARQKYSQHPTWDKSFKKIRVFLQKIMKT